MASDFGRKNGDVLAPENFRFSVRIRLPDGECLSDAVTCSANKPPKLTQVLESNGEKFAEIYPSPTGDIYGYIKLYDQDLDEFVDVPPFCEQTVRPKDKVELWYSHEKKHPKAVLMPTKDEPMEVEVETPVPVVPEIHVEFFKNSNVIAERDVQLTPGVPHPITELIKHVAAEYNFLAETKRYPREVFGWIMKNTGRDNYVEIHLGAELEGGATYQLHFVEYMYMILDDLTAYFILSNSDKGELQLARFEKQSHKEKLQKQDAFSDKRQEDLSKRNHEMIPKEVTPVKSRVFLSVFKNDRFVADDVFSFELSAPHTLKDLVAYVDEKHNLVENNEVCRKISILKGADDNIYTEVDLNGVVEDGMNYHVCVVATQLLIDSDRGVEDLSKRNHEMIPKEVTPVKSSAFLRVFKDNKFVVEDNFSFEASTPHTFQDLIAYLDEKHNLVQKNDAFRFHTCAWILKVADENNYTEVDLNGVVEDGMYYIVRFLTYSEFLTCSKGDISAYLKIHCRPSSKKLQFQLIERESAQKKTMDTSSDRRVEDPAKHKREMIPKEVTPVKSLVNLSVFKNDKFVTGDVLSFDPSTPHTFQDLIAHLDEKHNLVVKSSRFVVPTYAWILKVADNNYAEVDLNGVVEGGMNYHVRVVNTVYLIKDDVSAYLKVRWTGDKKLQFQFIQRESAKKKTMDTSSGRRVEDLAKHKRGDVAPVQSLVYLRVEKNRRLVVEDAVPFDSGSPLTFQHLIDHINAIHNVFAESKLFRQSIYVCIFKVVSDQKLIEIDLNGVVEGGATYHVHFSQSLFEIEDGVLAIFKISYGGHEYKKHEFELVKRVREKKTNNVNGRCEQFSKKEDQAVLSAKREINIQVYKNGTHLRTASMPITRSECPGLKSLISYLNNKLTIFENMWEHWYAWILKDIGENRYDEVDLDGVVEEGATYQVHFSSSSYCVEMLDVTAYFKLTYGVNEKLEFMQIVREYLRAKKNKENVSGRLVVREDHVPSSKYEEILGHRASESSRIQPEKDLIHFERGEIDLLLKTIKAEGLRRELPTILQDVPVLSKITSDSPKAITMVLLGETGVGKSTLINGMVNYIAYSSLSEAESNRPKYLIPARFLYDGKKILIGEQNANENIQFDGESATQRPTVYEFTENEQLYRIIDVPGIGDSRGVEQDRKNFDCILEEINRHKEINAFCILIPPNGSRITVAMRYCIYELLSNLHKDAARNIVFCFTKARSTFYKGGDTLPILRDYLANLKSQQDVEIALDEDQNMFYFDNEPFKYLWLKENGINLDHQRKEYDRSFNVSRESTVKLFEYVRNLPPHDTTAMKALTETRRLILNMVPISAAASKKIRMNKSSLEDQIEKLKCSRYQKKSLQDHLYMDVFEIKTTPLKEPRTVCASATCIEKVPIGDGKSGQCNVLYKQICHDECYVKSVTPGKYPDSALKDCQVFVGGKCNMCGCSWESHLHIKQLQEIIKTKAVNKELQKMLANNDIQHLSIADVIKSYEVQLDQLKEDEELIKKMSAKFSTFLRNNSMSIRNDVYADYLKHTLKMAEQELAVGGSYQKVAELQQSLHAYEAEVEFLMRSENSSGLVTIEDIFELKKELRALAGRHGEIGDMLNIAEGVTAMPVEPPAAKSPEKPEPEPRKAKKTESRSAEDSSKKSKKKANGGGKTYNKSMLDDFL